MYPELELFVIYHIPYELSNEEMKINGNKTCHQEDW